MSTLMNYDKHQLEAPVYVAWSLNGTEDVDVNQGPTPSIQTMPTSLLLNHSGQHDFTAEVDDNVHTSDHLNANLSIDSSFPELGPWGRTDAAPTTNTSPTIPDLSPTIVSTPWALKLLKSELGGDINQIQDAIQVHITNEDERTTQDSRIDSAIDTLQTNIEPEQANTTSGPLVCKSCGKEFTTSFNLKYHIWSRLGVKPFRCQELEEKKWNSEEEEELVPCPFRTTTPCTLKRHVKTIHKKVLGKWPQPDFSGYPDWVSNNHLPTLNHMASGSHTNSNNGA
ncbi:hypothetical protein K435DRAFT_936131 [Dendrothele bispora CBS 962.96]|uniref:C2H2-type domain-containing protein n=1 Tax=Dendrothele bispora (strain CBS 962.96) TaxID=1314807 RepID=A0A4V4HC17_DENBC|nr:hypothetical protein K435DRAFT_936131 [Dendrothele bispora CBS 962.96]